MPTSFHIDHKSEDSFKTKSLKIKDDVKRDLIPITLEADNKINENKEDLCFLFLTI